MNTEIFEAEDHGVEKNESSERKNIGATGNAILCEMGDGIALNSGSGPCRRWVSNRGILRRFQISYPGKQPEP
jgi:hypothetical protein